MQLTLKSHAIDSESGVRLLKTLRFPQIHVHYGFSIFDFFSLMSRGFSAWWTRKQENGRMAEMPTSTLNMSKCSSRIIQVMLKELSSCLLAIYLLATPICSTSHSFYHSSFLLPNSTFCHIGCHELTPSTATNSDLVPPCCD